MDIHNGPGAGIGEIPLWGDDIVSPQVQKSVAALIRGRFLKGSPTESMLMD